MTAGTATSQSFMRSVSEHILLERIGNLELRLQALEEILKKIQKARMPENIDDADRPSMDTDPNAWAFSQQGRQQGPEAWVKHN